MVVPRFIVLCASAAAVLVVTGAALGVGPWPGLASTVVASSGDVRYTAARSADTTTVKALRTGASPRVLASATFAGAYGIPAVTSNGRAGGLSPDGRLLVLAQPTNFQSLRAQTRFLLIATRNLAQMGMVVLRGEFGFDAVSPDRRILYLIQHASAQDLVRYVVRAYDLRAKKLLPGAIVDRREPDEAMRGYPVSRATSAGGAWVYTLYHPGQGKPFVHALNAAGRTAFCIDLPWQDAVDTVWNARLELSADGRDLRVRSGSGATAAIVDTKTLAVR